MKWAEARRSLKPSTSSRLSAMVGNVDVAVGVVNVPTVVPPLTTLVADANPRVRLEAVRALGKLGTARAAELALTILDQPMDAFLDYALWLTMNELATPWLGAVRSGAWSFQGREAQLAFGLKAVEPTLAVEVLAQLLTDRTLPRNGSGPWIELIGSAGGPVTASRDRNTPRR